MKKILLVLICISMILQPISSFADFSSEEVVAQSPDLEFAKAIGLIAEDKNDDDVVTRLDFAGVVMNIVLGESAGKGMNINVGFTDVPGDAYAVGFVRDIGIMNGVGNGMFAPGKPITYSQAIKSLISFFGYDEEALAYGGYPNGYLLVAANLKMTIPNINIDTELTFKMLSTLLKLGVNVNVKQRIYNEGKEIHNSTAENYLKFYKNIDFARGVVTAVHDTDLYSSSTMEYYDVKVDDIKLNLTEYSKDLINYLGYSANIYYTLDSNDDYELLYYELADNDVKKIDGYDILSFEKNKLKYDSNSKRVLTETLPYDVSVIYNGTFCPTYNESIINPFKNTDLDGGVTLIDNDGDGSTDVVIVDAYDSYVVSQIVNDKIYNKYRPDVVLDLKDVTYENTQFINILGEPISIDTIQEGDILTVSKDKSGNVKKLVLTVDTYTDIVKSLEFGSDGKLRKIIFDDAEYECTRALSLNPDMDILLPGAEIKCFFNKDMKISDIEASLYNRYLKGYLVDAAKKDTIDDIYQVKIFTAKGEYLVTEFENQIRYNEQSNKSQEEIISLFGTTNGMVKRQPVLYQLSDAGKINKICLADTAAINDVFYMYPGFDGIQARPTYFSAMGSFEGKLLINSDTLMFVVPEESNRKNYDEYHLVTTSYLRDQQTTPLFEAYGTESQNPVANILVFTGTGQVQYHGQQFCLVNEIIMTINENGDPVYKVDGIVNGTANTIFLDTEAVSATLTKGDVITYYRRPDGVAINIVVVYDQSTGEFTPDANPTQGFPGGYRFAVGKVIYADNSCFTVEITDKDGTVITESHPISNFRLSEYNSRSREPYVKIATLDNIYDSIRHPGDESKVFIFTHGGDARYIIIYNE